MIMARGKKLSRIRVSVPYRGATFLNNPETPLPVLSAMIVSVPYRGATFLNDNYTYEEAQKLLKSFRPLSGSYISQ